MEVTVTLRNKKIEEHKNVEAVGYEDGFYWIRMLKYKYDNDETHLQYRVLVKYPTDVIQAIEQTFDD